MSKDVKQWHKDAFTLTGMLSCTCMSILVILGPIDSLILGHIVSIPHSISVALNLGVFQWIAVTWALCIFEVF